VSHVEGAVEALRAWKADPKLMVRNLFGIDPDAWQRQACDAWGDKDHARMRIALQACAGPGKSAVLAWLGWNALLCYSDGVNHPNGLALSISRENLRDNLWKELAVWRERSPVLQRAFDMTTERIFSREHPTTWYLAARSFSKSADPDAQGRTLSGLHAKSVFYLVDESGDLPPAVLRAAEQGLSNCDWGRIIQAGNPTSHAGALYVCVTEQSDQWETIRINGDPDDPGRSPRIDVEWAKGQIQLYGRDNPWVMAYILGKFPPSSLNALLGPDDVRAAMGRHLRIDQYEFAQKRLGIDVARFGDDRTVIFPRQGLAAFKSVTMRNARSEAIAGRIAVAKERWGSELELIDSTGGWAAGVVDAARLGGINILEINFSGNADDSRYFNKRSEMYFRAAEWVKNGGALPNNPALVREATAATYYFDKGRLRVIEKDQIKKLLNGQSPDEWDAFVTTFAVVEQPTMAGLPVSLQPSHTTTHEWDPYANKEG